MTRSALLVLLGGLLIACNPAMSAQPVGFGDDAGDYANDGECDDPRFEGAGMTSTALLSDDILHDATDCRSAFDAGNLTLRGVNADGTILFGDDTGEYARDGECDDMRFTGSGMTETPLIQADILHDATDCQAAYTAGKLKLHMK